jgi:hypothetical protein
MFHAKLLKEFGDAIDAGNGTERSIFLKSSGMHFLRYRAVK